MKTLKELTESFKITSSEERKDLVAGNAPKSFKEIAECILAGNFLVTDGKVEVKVHPTVLEFYYHEEKTDGIKDYIVYHRNNTSSTKSLIPTGFLHNHVSGIDLTFEHDNEGMVRASVLIREFKIEPCSGDQEKSMKAFNIKVDEEDGRSTGMYTALFSMFSVFDGGFNVSWEDGTSPAEVEFSGPRKNVNQYDENGKKIETIGKDGKTEYLPCTRKWSASIKK